MRQKTLFYVFFGFVALFLFVQLPLWFLLVEQHGAEMPFVAVGGGPASLRDAAYIEQEALSQPQQVGMERLVPIAHLDRQHANPEPTGRLSLVPTIPSCDDDEFSDSVTSNSLLVMAFCVDCVDIHSFPWDYAVDILYSDVPLNTSVRVVLITLIDPNKANFVFGEGQCGLLRSLAGKSTNAPKLELRSLLHNGVPVSRAAAIRNAWRSISLVMRHEGKTIPTTRFTFLSPYVDVGAIQWSDVFKNSLSAHCDVLCSMTLTLHEDIVSDGLVLNLGDNDDLIVSAALVGYQRGDLRSIVGGGERFFPSSVAFSAATRSVVALWPFDDTVIPWETRAAPSSPLHCSPSDDDFFQFMTAWIKKRLARKDTNTLVVKSSGIQVPLRHADPACHNLWSLSPHMFGGDALQDLLMAPPPVKSDIGRDLKQHYESQLPRVIVEWETFCIPCFGFTNEVMQYLVPLEGEVYIKTPNQATCFCDGTPTAFQEAISRISSSGNWKNMWQHRAENSVSQNTSLSTQSLVYIHIAHKDPGSFPSFSRSSRPDVVVGRAMYEFTKIPNHWLGHKDDVDEIWVPCRFVKWVFERAGFAPEKLIVIPEPMDVFTYDPSVAPRIELPPAARHLRWIQASNAKSFDAAELRSHFKFFSVFKWEERKGWEVLLEAFCGAFSSSDPVSLYLATYLYGEGRNADHVLERIKSFVNTTLQLPWSSVPHIHIISEQLTEQEILSLYASVDAFVLPTKGEGWGLPAIQAMSMALPTIVSNWSGVSDFATETNSLLIPVVVEELPKGSEYGAQKIKLWGVANVTAVKHAMIFLQTHPAEGKRIGARARRDIIAQFSGEAVAQIVKSRLLFLAKQHRDKQLSTDERHLHKAVGALLGDHHLIL